MMGAEFPAEAQMLPASPRPRTEGRTGPGIRIYLFGKPAYGAKDRVDFAEIPSRASHVVGDLSAGEGSVVIVVSAKLSVLDGSHRRRLAMFGKASSDARARRALALSFFMQRMSSALSRVKGHFLPDFARGGHGKEARAAYDATAAAQRAAIAASVLHEVGHWSLQHPQPRRLAASMAAADAPEPCAAIPGTAGHVCTAVAWDFVSERSVWPGTLDLGGELAKGPSVPPAGPYATLHGRAAGHSAVSGACILVHGPSGAGKSGLAAAFACRHGIETVPAGTSRQLVSADMCVPCCGAVLPAVWQPDFSVRASHGFEVVPRPGPVQAVAAPVPDWFAGGGWPGGASGFWSVDHAVRVSRWDVAGGRVSNTNGMTGSIVIDPGRSGVLEGRSGNGVAFYNGSLIRICGDESFVLPERSGAAAGFGAMTGHDSGGLLYALWQNSLAGTHAVTSPRTQDAALTASKDAGIHTSYTGWKTDAVTGLHKGPLIDWDAAAARRKSDVVSCEITDLFEDDTTACIFPRRARDLFYGREIPPGDKPAGRAAAEREAGIINFAPRKSSKKTPGDIADVAAAR